MSATCVVCSRPTPDQAYACSAETARAGGQLAEIVELTGPARDVAHGQTSRGGAGGSGKPGSRLPFDLGATARLDAVQNTMSGWARHIAAERGVGMPFAPGSGIDPIALCAEWLTRQLEWARHRREVSELLEDVERCARVVRGLARGPSEQKYLGPCGAVGYMTPDGPVTHEPCDGDVYGPRGGSRGSCRVCGAEVAQRDREAWLDAEVRAHAFRAAEIEEAYGISANLIRQWATPARGLIQVHGLDLDGRQLYLLAQVLDVAAGQAAKRAEAQAKRARKAATRQEEDAA